MADYPLIQDKTPHSWPEVYFALALTKFNIPFFFQYLIGKRASVRGSLIVDFVIIRPFYQAVEIFGEYWHTGQLGSGDKLKLDIERRYFKRETIVIWADQLPDQDAADKLVQEKIL